jgi:hypothetical protein
MNECVGGLDGRSPLRIEQPRREVMVEPEAVTTLLRLRALGWGSKRIARELGISRGTVKRYIEAGGWQPFSNRCAGSCSMIWTTGCASGFAGTAAMPTWCARSWRPRRASLPVCGRCSGRSSLTGRSCWPRLGRRFASRRRPAGSCRSTSASGLVEIAGRKVKVFLFVATLGYSRRLHVRAFRHERQESWFDGMESSFLAFGGVPEEVLFDNPRALVTEHDAETRTVVFNAKLLAFARHWGFRPRACAPYRARTKGKTERGFMGTTSKRNAIAGRSFASWEAFEAHLAAWERDIANARVHGTTGEAPMVRFARDEAAALQPLADRPSFRTCRTLERRVRNDCAVEVDGNAYSPSAACWPWRIKG